MLQIVLGARHFEDEKKQDETLQLWGSQTVKEDVLVIHEEKHALSGEEDHYDYLDDLDEEMEVLIDDEQGKLFLQNDTSLSEDRMDNGLEIFVKEEGLNQIKNLILQEHADNVMFGDIYLNMMIMKIGLDVLPRIRKRGMNNFLLL
jgi:hypothetical protein